MCITQFEICFINKLEVVFIKEEIRHWNWNSDPRKRIIKTGLASPNWLTAASGLISKQSQRTTFFSISGDTTKKRHFFINRGYAGNCAGDTGWMVIAGKECDWERGHQHKNPILYSKLSKYTKWEEKSDLTDTLCLYDINSASTTIHLSFKG